MTFTNQIKNNLINNLNNSYNVYLSLRYLERNITKTNENKKNQLRDLFIYLAILGAIILIILGGYAIYKKYIERRAIRDIEELNQNIILNFQNSLNSGSSSSPEEQRPHSYNNEGAAANRQNYDSEMASQSNNYNNSFNNNHEERMEKIRQKYGNSLVIKILLKKYIEEDVYTKILADNYGDNCTICVNNFNNNEIISKTPCEHIFHKDCFNRYLKNINDKDKLICPNCNQNLLINKNNLKLRKKPEKIQVLKKDKSKIKNFEIDIHNNEEIKNNASEMTNKNVNSDNGDIYNVHKNKGHNEIIFIKRRKIHDIKVNNNTAKNFNSLKDKDKDSSANKNTNIYNLIEYSNDSAKKKNKNNEKDKDKESNKDNNIIINKDILRINRREYDIYNNMKDSVINLKTQKYKERILPNKSNKNIIAQNEYLRSGSKEVDSDRIFVNNKKVPKHVLPTSKLDDN